MRRTAGKILTAVMLLVTLGALGLLGREFVQRFRWRIQAETVHFTESAEELRNPDRGFYAIYGFRIKEEPVDYAAELAERMKEDTDTTLAMLQINLQEYRGGALSGAALENIENLFQAVSGTDKRWIVRFLYDWYGENEQYEPQDIGIITGHMEQLGGILKTYKDCIFTLQGLFIGNWGEMNGTRYADQDSMRQLTAQLLECTDETTFLAVRTPAQWRKITGTADIAGADGEMARRLGLFNDGMLGSESDYGTYGGQTRAEAGETAAWTRTEELAFQEELCGKVPNGGEVIVDNAFNDLETAIADLRTMHVTYLNENYDRKVLEKWAADTVHTGDCFDGMDGLTYISRHLGYRLLLSGAELSQEPGQEAVELSFSLKNVGFAPLYRACDMRLVLCAEDGGSIYEKEFPADLSGLTGGDRTEQEAVFTVQLPMPEIEGAGFTVWLQMSEPVTEERIIFANEQTMGENGYQIGKFTVNKLNIVEIINRLLSQKN